MYVVSHNRQLKLTHSEGREARMKDYGKVITSLIKDERVESNFISLSETRNYAERLIAEAIKHGDKHQPTMELADFWINDKQAIHKLFKVNVTEELILSLYPVDVCICLQHFITEVYNVSINVSPGIRCKNYTVGQSYFYFIKLYFFFQVMPARQYCSLVRVTQSQRISQVLVPRFQNTSFSYTKMYKAPTVYPGHPHPRAVLELRSECFTVAASVYHSHL